VNPALFTDLYELTMAAGYHGDGFDALATFELSIRAMPERNFFVVAGVDEAVADVLELRFGDAELAYLESLGRFDGEFLAHLAGLRFAGAIDAVAEGEVAFPGEPILAVTAPIIVAQLLETYLLNAVGFQTLIASKAARVGIACAGRTFVDFGARRSHGPDAGLWAARSAVIGGAAATSLVAAGERYGLPVTGTMAHSYVLAHGDEAEAFRSFARRFPDNAALLIDTFDTVEGARIAAAVADDIAAEGIAVQSVRLDSGDLGALSRQVRTILDDAGHPEIRILASGDLDEHRIADLVGAGAPIDGFGVGTRLGTSADAPSLPIVYKLVVYDGDPVMKHSPGKVTLPGRKQVYRQADRDVLALEAEPALEGRALLDPVVVDGNRVRRPAAIAATADRAATGIAALAEPLRSLDEAEPWPVVSSAALTQLTGELGG
jgi:nicotinate phosphoribosyltransferase